MDIVEGSLCDRNEMNGIYPRRLGFLAEKLSYISAARFDYLISKVQLVK